MGLSSALATAMSGLRSTQASLSIISSNVANAQTPGYVAQNPNQIEVASGDYGSTVATNGVNRQLDLFVQNQLRTETAGGGYADQMANILGQLQSVYGTPGGDGTLEGTLNNFTTALQSLSNNPSDSSAQSVALSAAQSLAQQLNTTTQGIQTLRTNVSQDLGTSTTAANGLMTQIAQFNTQLQGLSSNDPLAATLMDQRDSAINQLAKYADIRTVTDGSNQTNVFTTFGHPARRRRTRVPIPVHLAGLAERELAVQHRPDPERRRLAHHQAAERRIARRRRQQCGELGPDRGRHQAARPDPGAGADPGRPARRNDVLGAVGQDHGGHAGLRSAIRLRRQYLGSARGNTINLTYTDSSNVQHQIKIVNTSDPSSPALQNGANANPIAGRRQFLAGHGLGGVAAQRRARRRAPAVHQSLRLDLAHHR